MIYFPQYNVSKGVYTVTILGIYNDTETVVVLETFQDLTRWYIDTLHKCINTISYIDAVNIYNFIDKQACKASTNNYKVWKIKFLENVINILSETPFKVKDAERIYLHLSQEYLFISHS